MGNVKSTKTGFHLNWLKKLKKTKFRDDVLKNIFIQESIPFGEQTSEVKKKKSAK